MKIKNSSVNNHPNYSRCGNFSTPLFTPHVFCFFIACFLLVNIPSQALCQDLTTNEAHTVMNAFELAALPTPKPLRKWAAAWLEKWKYGSASLLKTPVTFNSTIRMQSAGEPNFRLPGINNFDGYLLSQNSRNFGALNNNENRLDLLEAADIKSRRSSDIEKVLADTLNLGFLTMSSRLDFRAGSHFLPYLGGGFVYGGLDAGHSLQELNGGIYAGWEVGLGFTLIESPFKFGVDALYRGLRFEDQDKGSSANMDKAYPKCMDFSGYSISGSFSYSF